jgi:hypothetical protein
MDSATLSAFHAPEWPGGALGAGNGGYRCDSAVERGLAEQARRGNLVADEEDPVAAIHRRAISPARSGQVECAEQRRAVESRRHVHPIPPARQPQIHHGFQPLHCRGPAFARPHRDLCLHERLAAGCQRWVR